MQMENAQSILVLQQANGCKWMDAWTIGLSNNQMDNKQTSKQASKQTDTKNNVCIYAYVCEYKTKNFDMFNLL